MSTINEERVSWNQVFYAETFDFCSQMNFRRYDECIFVRCTLLMDDGTEQIAFTRCTFKDCNVDSIEADESRGIICRDNIFDRPLEEQAKEFNERLTAALSRRAAKS